MEQSLKLLSSIDQAVRHNPTLSCNTQFLYTYVVTTERREDVLVPIGPTAEFRPVFEIVDDVDDSREVFTGEYTFNTLAGGGSPHSMMSFSQLTQAMFKQGR